MKQLLWLMAVSSILMTSCITPYKNLRTMEFSDLQYPYPVKYVQLNNDVQLAYVDQGSGDQTIIFIHGLGSYLPAWKKNIAELRDHYRCIALDLPGYGKSSKGMYPIGMAFYADIIKQFMDKLDIVKAVVAGHSMGSQIAMTLAIQHPEKISKLILTAPAGFEQFSPGEGQWFKDVVTPAAVRATPVQQIRANVQMNFYNMPADAEFMVTDRIALRKAADFDLYCYTVSKAVAGMVDEPVYDYLSDISQPTLIIFGENDNLIPNPYLHGGRSRDIGKIGDEKIPHSELLMVPGCGHFVQYEKPEIYNQAVLNFLK